MKQWLLALLAGLFSASPLPAQNATGTLVGHVNDGKGGAVPNAAVTIVNVDTQEERSLTTNAVGDYTVSLLKPGNYRVAVSAAGFKKETTSGIVLNVDQTARVETALSVGGAAETVSVAADALSLDTDTATVGALISGQQISELPLNGRNFQDLMFLSPGAVNNPGGEANGGRIIISGDSIAAVSLGGSRGSSEGYTVDGTTILDIGHDTPSFAPSLEDISEFNELTKSYSAAYGYSMNQINLTSKSGTNSYHGSAFEFLRNSTVDASYHGYDPKGGALPLLRQNQFGYSLGGPVRIPKLYYGRDKTFFFANYEGFRHSTGGEQPPTTVPSADEMMGKFDASVLGNFTAAQVGTTAQVPTAGYTQCGHTYHAGDPHPLFNPFDPNGCPFPEAADGSYTIPSANISQLGKLIVRPGLYYPSGPNIAGAARGNPNYSFNSATVESFDQQNYRIDQNFGTTDQLFFHAVKHEESTSGGSDTPTNATSSTQPARLYTATETHIFSGNFTNQFRLGYSQAFFSEGPGITITPADLSLIAFPNAFTAPGFGYPRLEYDSNTLNDGLTYSGGAPFIGSASTSLNDIWEFGESATWIVKRHTLNFGFGGRRNHLILQTGDATLGRLNYNGQESGDAFADSLLGAPALLALTELGPLSDPNVAPTVHLHFPSLAPYVQDDWKVNDKLTLNLGLRYEFIATANEEQNSLIWPDFSAPEGAEYIANSKIASAYGGVNPFSPSSGLYVPAPNGERGPGPAPKDDFAPRIGFAYRLSGNDKTMIRGGFGKYLDTIEANELAASSDGVYPSTSAINTGTDIGQIYPNTYNTNSLPATPPGATPLQGQYDPTSPSTGYVNPLSNLGFIQIQGDRYLNPYYLGWNLGVERELPWATKLEVDYVGNHGTHLFSRSNPNAPVQCIAINGCTVTASTPASVPAELRVPYPRSITTSTRLRRNVHQEGV